MRNPGDSQNSMPDTWPQANCLRQTCAETPDEAGVDINPALPLLSSALPEPTVNKKALSPCLAEAPYTTPKGQNRSLYTNMLQKAVVTMPSYARKVKDEWNPVVRVYLFIFGELNKFINCANICVIKHRETQLPEAL